MVAGGPAGQPLRLGTVVLAAGAGSRFSSRPGGKMLADLGGRPLLEHVLAAVRDYGPEATVVVVGHGWEAIELSIDWAGELRARNREPDRGISSSLQVGLRTLALLPGRLDGAFIVLGDQPLVRPDVFRALADAATTLPRQSGGPSIVLPRYDQVPGSPAADLGPRNPALLLRHAWSLADELTGERGIAAVAIRDPSLVLDVPVTGGNPDVDTPDDLAALSGGVLWGT